MKYKITIYILLIPLFFFAQDTLKLSLAEAVNYAKEHNLNKVNALLDVDKAKEVVKETIGIGLPQIGGTVNYQNYIQQPVQPFGDQLIVFGSKQSASVGGSLQQLLFDGSYIVGIQSTKAYTKISELAVDKTDRAIIEAVLQSYSAVLINEEAMKILQKNLANSEKNLHDVNEIYRVGLGEQQSVEQMAYNNNVIKNAIINNENNLKIIIQNLKFVLNIPKETPLELTTDFDEILKDNLSLVDDEDLNSLEDHIDMQIADNQIITSKLQVKFQKSKYLPNLAGNIATQYNAYSDKFNFFNQRWYNTTFWGIGLNIPVFSGLQRKARVSQAKIDLQKSETQRQNTWNEVNRNAREKYLSYQNAVAQFNLAQSQVELSESIYSKEKIKFYAGLGSSQELTVTENQMYQAQTQLVQSVSQLVTQKIALLKAIDNFEY